MENQSTVAAETTKLCLHCKEVKAASEFYISKTQKNRLQSMCKRCSVAAMRKWQKLNPDRVRQKKKRYRERHKEQIKKTKRRYYLSFTPAQRKIRQEKKWELSLIRNFGVTVEWYRAKFSQQGSSCAICKDAVNGNRKFPVDHCHELGHVRGILCHRCNTALERIDTIPLWAELAQEYKIKNAKPPGSS